MLTQLNKAHDRAFELAAALPQASLVTARRCLDQALATGADIDGYRQSLVRQGFFATCPPESQLAILGRILQA